MIPKIIHYCWFGHGEMPELTKKCIKSWKKYLPNYELMLWDENNFDINLNQYVKGAYEQKRYAFVTDYVRLYALYHHGGIYMDTDVEVLKPLDRFLVHGAFTGNEGDKSCVTGTMGAEKNHPWIKSLLDEYRDRKFILDNGKINIVTNTILITKLTINNYNWKPKDSLQTLRDELYIYPTNYFCAKSLYTGSINITEDTYTIHHFSGSWLSDKDRNRVKRRRKIKQFIEKIIGRKGLNFLLGIVYYIRHKNA
ncbi:glycosyltransferase [Tissierella praeacuta]|uniref:glycosyltransferase family 32 protein n=1 Tax=Tissierella praeacuta TaxID=43131 RepID=UPI00333EE094